MDYIRVSEAPLELIADGTVRFRAAAPHGAWGYSAQSGTGIFSVYFHCKGVEDKAKAHECQNLEGDALLF